MMESSGRRIVALWFPRLSTDRLQRRWKARTASSDPSPEREAPPLVVVAKVDNALRLTALDRKATAMGLTVGMPLGKARAMLPELKVITANEPADLKLLGRIADWCDRFTPFVALDGARGLILDVTGATHLAGGEQALLDAMRSRLNEQGFAVRGALAATAMAARALVRYRDGIVVPAGDEAKAIAPLPVEALHLDGITTHGFRRAGLKTMGAVAGRARGELNARFGAAMVFKLEQALGRSEKPISPRTPLPDYSAQHNFAEPVVTEDVIRATIRSLATSLSDVLEKRGEGARRLEAVFFRADGAVRRIVVETGAPLHDPVIIERLFRERLDALADPLDPGFGFDLIRLCANRAERAAAEVSDFDADLNAKREIRFLVDRLAARFGSHRILAFQPNDTHIPEAAWAAVPAQHAMPTKLAWRKIRREREAPRRPLRLFTRPEPVSLLTAVSPHLRWRHVQRELSQSEGPERIAMEWWRAPQPARDYFRAEDSEGRRYWLYRDGLERDAIRPRWFLHGIFA